MFVYYCTCHYTISNGTICAVPGFWILQYQLILLNVADFQHVYVDILCIVGASLSKPHIYVVSEFRLSLCLSVGPCVHNTIIYKCYSNLRMPLIVDCSFEQCFPDCLCSNIQETVRDK